MCGTRTLEERFQELLKNKEPMDSPLVRQWIIDVATERYSHELKSGYKFVIIDDVIEQEKIFNEA